MKKLIIPGIISIIISGIIAYFAPNTETVYGVWCAGASFLFGILGLMGIVISFIEPPQ